MTTPLDRERLERDDANSSEYTLAIITDEDQSSEIELEDGQVGWQSRLRYDRLTRRIDPATGAVSYHIEKLPPDLGGEHHLISLIAEGGRGAEFSELVKFGKHLMAFDDRTGLVCEVRKSHQLIPRQILMTGSGDEKFKGFKSEWATLKADQLVVGSHGKKPEEEWIKVLGPDYRLKSVDWAGNYQSMRDALGIPEQGYLTHEAGEWHPDLAKWLFFPRKISMEPFDEPVDERERGGNILIIADESFNDIRTVTVGERTPERGVSSFKILPGCPNEFVGLKSVEIGDRTETYLFCFDIDGNILKEDTFIGHYKCEGVEVM